MINFNDSAVNEQLNDLRREEEEKLVQSLAPQYGLEYINLHGYTINPEAVAFIPEPLARAAQLVAFDMSFDTLKVALRSPNDAVTLQQLEATEKSSRRTIIPYLASSDSLEHVFKRYTDIVSSTAKVKGVFEIDADDIKKFTQSIKTSDDVATHLATVAGTSNARRITETLELIFAGAIALGSSDIHIEPEESVVRLRYRLDGVLYDVYNLDRFIYDRMMSRLKLLAGMTLNKRKQAQDGRFTFNGGDRDVEVRASVIPGAAGESIVMRILDPTVASFTLDKIDLNPILRAVMLKELQKPNGLIITTGPTGSGKTTALYAFLSAAYSDGVKIITIENPVEYKLAGIVQTQTGDDYTFAAGLRAVLRQDPDIIMVGEIRDREVAETAIHAAQTGHLVFSTLHTNSAVGGFPRLIDLGIEPRSLGTAISVFLGQRLVRRLCPTCKKSYPASNEEVAIIKQILQGHPAPPELASTVTLYKAGGCSLCGDTGFKGRLGIFEAVLMDKAVEEVVIRDPREHLILEAAKPQGIPTMLEDGIVKVLNGDTSLTELERIIELPKLQEVASAETDPTAPNDDAFLAHVVS